jgi:hypothetical protein
MGAVVCWDLVKLKRFLDQFPYPCSGRFQKNGCRWGSSGASSILTVIFVPKFALFHVEHSKAYRLKGKSHVGEEKDGIEILSIACQREVV